MTIHVLMMYMAVWMDSQANNYNADANVDDNSCTYDVNGCMDSQANNYNADANVDDNSCTYDVYGCMDSQANNYNAGNVDNYNAGR